MNGSVSRIADAVNNANDWKQSASDCLILNFSFPPSLNHYLGRRGVQSYLTPRAKAFNYEVYAVVLGAKANLNLDTPLTVWYQYWFPDKRKRDIANYEKVLTDSMVKAGVMVDDHLIHDLRQTKMGYCTEGGVKVIITPHVKVFVPA